MAHDSYVGNKAEHSKILIVALCNVAYNVANFSGLYQVPFPYEMHWTHRVMRQNLLMGN